MCLFLLTSCDHFRKTAADLSIVSQGGKQKPALTKVAGGGKVHSVAGSGFTGAVLRADYQVTSVSPGPAFRRWWHLTPALCGRRSNCRAAAVRSKAFLSRSGVCPLVHTPPESQRGCPPFTSASRAQYTGGAFDQNRNFHHQTRKMIWIRTM